MEVEFTVSLEPERETGVLISALLKRIGENGIRGAFFNNRLGTPRGAVINFIKAS